MGKEIRGERGLVGSVVRDYVKSESFSPWQSIGDDRRVMRVRKGSKGEFGVVVR